MKFIGIELLPPDDILLGIRFTNGVAEVDDEEGVIKYLPGEGEGIPVKMFNIGLLFFTITIIF